MPSLEHLIQHYMTFSDGLPINLRHPVPPRSKPPLPNFATIPKSNRRALKSPPSLSPINNNEAAAATTTTSSMRPPTKRNVSIPNDAMMMNTIGICAAGDGGGSGEKQSSPSKSKNIDLLNFRSLKMKSPRKNIIIDGMKSLKKKQSKNNEKPAAPVAADVERLPPQLSTSLTNLSFSSDLKLASINIHSSPPTPASPLDTLYNVPTNNTMVVTATVEAINNNVVDNTATNTDYFTARDSDYFSAQDKDTEEIYFIDAPAIIQQESSSSAVPPPLPNSAPPKMSKPLIGYTAFRHVPHFPDGASTSIRPAPDNNNQAPLVYNRLDSSISLQSTASDRFFRQQSSVDSSASPRILPTDGSNKCTTNPMYFIPKDNLELHEVLGEGEFGSVYRGSFRREAGDDENKIIPVAVKTLHDEHCTQNRTEFLREASVMIKLQHHCIVNMIGISRVSILLKNIPKIIIHYNVFFRVHH